MLVIHPTDRTTEMLSILYEGLEARLIEADCSNKEMGHLLHHTSPSDSSSFVLIVVASIMVSSTTMT